MVKRTVLTDVYSWRVPVAGFPKGEYRTARRGDVIEVSQAEAERGEGLGALGTAEEAARAEALATGAEATGPVPVEQLRGYTVDQLVAHLQQNPHDAERVRALEDERDPTRKTVVELVEKVITERDRAAEEDARTRALAEEGAGAPA